MPEKEELCLLLPMINLFLLLLIGILLSDLRKNPSPINLGWLEAGRRLLHPVSLRIELVFYKILAERFGRELLISVLFSLTLIATLWTFYLKITPG